MALSSTDETDLLLPLLNGAYEDPPFRTFLARLLHRTDAAYVAIVIHEQGRPIAEEAIYFAGPDLRQRARDLGFEALFILEGFHQERLRPGRVYSVSDFTDHDPALKAKRSQSMERLGIVDERVMRIPGLAGYNVAMVLSRGKPCTASDSALLSNLSPYVAAAVSGLYAKERAQGAATLASEGLHRSGMGWIAFDREARVTTVDPRLAQRLEQITGSRPRPGERLRGLTYDAERALLAAAAEMAAEVSASPRALRLFDDQPLDVLLTRPATSEDAAFPIGAMIAFCRFARRTSPQGADRLVDLYGLPAREAELAIALTEGLSIAEAADALGLTVETARNYTKRLYAKLGVRGQTELVRLVLESSAMLG